MTNGRVIAAAMVILTVFTAAVRANAWPSQSKGDRSFLDYYFEQRQKEINEQNMVIEAGQHGADLIVKEYLANVGRAKQAEKLANERLAQAARAIAAAKGDAKIEAMAKAEDLAQAVDKAKAARKQAKANYETIKARVADARARNAAEAVAKRNEAVAKWEARQKEAAAELEARRIESDLDRQQKFVSIVEAFAAQYLEATAGQKKGELRAERAKALCDMMKIPRVKDWVGTIQYVTDSSTGYGSMIVAIGSNHPSQPSDTGPIVSGEVPAGTPARATLARLKTGQTIVFSGQFTRDSLGKDCFKEERLTQSGGMTDPKWTFEFSSVQPAKAGKATGMALSSGRPKGPGKTSSTGRGQTGPSFSCPSSRDPLAQLICSSPDLSEADLKYVQAYQALSAQLDPSGQGTLRQESVAFDKTVRSQCGVGAPDSQKSASSTAIPCVLQHYRTQTNLLTSRLTGAAAEEAARSLQTHIALQGALKRLGFLPADASVDGVFGPVTRKAIAQWQGSHGRRVTGFLDNSDGALLERQAAGGAMNERDKATTAKAEVPTQGKKGPLGSFVEGFKEGIKQGQAK